MYELTYYFGKGERTRTKIFQTMNDLNIFVRRLPVDSVCEVNLVKKGS